MFYVNCIWCRLYCNPSIHKAEPGLPGQPVLQGHSLPQKQSKTLKEKAVNGDSCSWGGRGKRIISNPTLATRGRHLLKTNPKQTSIVCSCLDTLIFEIMTELQFN